MGRVQAAGDWGLSPPTPHPPSQQIPATARWASPPCRTAALPPPRSRQGPLPTLPASTAVTPGRSCGAGPPRTMPTRRCSPSPPSCSWTCWSPPTSPVGARLDPRALPVAAVWVAVPTRCRAVPWQGWWCREPAPPTPSSPLSCCGSALTVPAGTATARSPPTAGLRPRCRLHRGATATAGGHGGRHAVSTGCTWSHGCTHGATHVGARAQACAPPCLSLPAHPCLCPPSLSPPLQLFQGNWDASTPAVRLLGRMVQARHVRILPQDFHNRIVLRTELLGCPPGMGGRGGDTPSSPTAGPLLLPTSAFSPKCPLPGSGPCRCRCRCRCQRCQ